MKNKGFTLVEIMAVIVILGVIITIAVPNVLGTSKGARQKMYESKVEMIVNAAQIYAQDNYDIIYDSNTKTKKIMVSDLVNSNYLKKDDKSCVLGNGCIKDPRNNMSLDNKNICLCIVDKRARAVYIGNSTECSISVCKGGNNFEGQ